jgi:hypothetical protein
MQTFKSNLGLKHQSLDTLYFFGDKLPKTIFKYNHTIKSLSKQFNAEVEQSISLREDYIEMAMEGTKRDGFYEGSLVKKGVSHQIFRFLCIKLKKIIYSIRIDN